MRFSFLIALLVCCLGLFALSRMHREIDPPNIQHTETIVSYLPGTSPKKLDELVTRPVERILNSAPNIGDVGARTTDGISIVTFELSDRAKRDETLGIIRDRLNRLRSAMQIEAPFLVGPDLQIDSGQVDSGLLLLTGEDNFETTRLAAAKLISELRSNAAIASAEISHDQPRAVVIRYSDEDLADAGLTPPELAEFIRASAQQFPGGFLASGESHLSINIGRGIFDLESLRDLPVRDPRDGSVTPLSEICEITSEPWEADLGGVYLDEKPAVGITFSKAGSASWEEVSAAIDEVRSAQSEININLFFYRGATTDELVQSASRTVIFSILVVLLCVTFGLGLRAGLAASVAVATTLLGSVFLLYLFGVGLNVVTLAALAVGIGLLIDNHIVIAHHVGLAGTKKTTITIDPRSKCWKDLATPLIIAAATTALGFLPAWLMRNEAAGYVSSLFIVIGTLLFVSQIVGFAITPTLASTTARKNKLLEQFGAAFEKTAKRLLKVPRLIVATAIGIAVIALVFLRSSTDTPMAAIPTQHLSVDLTMPAGASPGSTSAAAKAVSTTLSEKYSRPIAIFLNRPAPHVYRGTRDTPPAPNRAQLVLSFDSTSELPAIDIDMFEGKIPENATLRVRRISATPVNPEPIAIRIYGSTEQIEKTVAGNSDFAGVEEGTLVEEFTVAPDLETAATQKVTTSEIALGTLAVTGGIPVSFLPDTADSGNRLPILLKVASDETNAADRLDEAYVHRQSGGDPVPLEDIAKISKQTRPIVISRWNGANVGYLTASQKENAIEEEQQMVSKLELKAADLKLEAIGEWAQSQETERQIFRHLIPVSIGILLLLLIQSRSTITVLIIVLAVVPSLLGAGLVTYLFTGFGVMQLLGIIALIGIVVNNAIVLADRLRSENARTDHEILAVSRTRFVPILLSASCAILGLVPLIISGNTLWIPFATVMIAGLLVSTVTTLTFLPALWKLAKT